MKKTFFILMSFVLLVALWSGTCLAAEFGDLLTRLNSRDFSAEINTLTGTDGPYVGEQTNPHAQTVMFKARDEFRALVDAARGSADKSAELSAFIFDAQKQEVSNETKIWLIQQLPATVTVGDVPALEELLASDQQAIIAAAAAVLAKIPGQEALDALTRYESNPDVKSALVSRVAPVPALNPDETELPFALPYISDDAVAEWMKGYDALSELQKMQTLAALSVRGDKKYRSKALEAIASDSADLQLAGLASLEKLGETADLDLILARHESNRDLVMALCTFIVADGFDEALRTKAMTTDNEALFSDLATILVNRGIDLRADLFARTLAKECPNRLALLRMLSKLASKDDIPNLVASTVLIPRGADHDAAENLIAACCAGDAAPVIALLNQYPPAVLYPIMGRTGGDAAKEELTKALDTGSVETKALAIRAITLWPNATFADKIMTMLTDGNCTDSQAVSLLRSYIRVISLPDDKIGLTLTADEKLANLKNAYGMAKRVDEKRLVLSRLAANRTNNSLAFALECAADPEVAEAAYAAIADHAHDTGIRNRYPELTLKALDLVLEKCQNKDIVERAKVYKGRMQ
ncbi:MAG: hypothetical protein Q4G68_10365 [Planctomycetia bacterium]|nr:hypothetical protein [Planctomycetia bacterium]